MENNLKQVSCYLNENLKYAIEKEVNHFKYKSVEDRATINKNMSFIIEDFIDAYIDKIDDVSGVIMEVMSVFSFDEVNSKDLSKTLAVGLKPYPLKLSDNFTKKMNSFRVKCNEALNFKFTKTGFYNLILLHYFINNKVRLAKMDLEFWSQDYFKRSDSNGDFDEVLSMFNKLLEENKKGKDDV